MSKNNRSGHAVISLQRSCLNKCIKLALAGFIIMPAISTADTLSVGVTNTLTVQTTGNGGNSSGGFQILQGARDTSFLRDGLNGAVFNYTIRGQVSAEADPFSSASARLSGNVDFTFNLPPAIWKMRTTITYRGAQSSGSNANASAGVVDASATGSVNGFPTPTLQAFSSQFFSDFSDFSGGNNDALGIGVFRLGLNIFATSSSSGFSGGGEAYAGFGQFSNLSNFNLDNNLHASNSFSNDGIFVHLELLPSLALTGHTLNSSLNIKSGETLSGFGNVNGNISGVGSIRAEGVREPGGFPNFTPTPFLTIGNSASVDGVNHTGSVQVGNSFLNLLDADNAFLGGDVTIAGGLLTASNGITIDGSLTGKGTVSGNLFLNENGVISAVGLREITTLVDGIFITTTEGLTLGKATSTTGVELSGTLNVGSSKVRLLDANSAELGSLTTIDNGELIAANGFDLGAGDVITGQGLIRGDISGVNATNGVQATGQAVLSGDNPLQIGADKVTILSNSATSLFQTFIDGGELHSDQAVILSDASLEGFGTVSADFFTQASTQVISLGTGAGTGLTLGNANSVNGVQIDGVLSVGSSTVTLLDANEAQLNRTTIDDGELIAVNGIHLDTNLVDSPVLDTITGRGIIRGKITGTDLANRLIATGVATIASSIDVASDDVTILTTQAVNLGNVILAGGSLRSTAGLSFAPNSSVSGFGDVVGDVSLDASSTIEAIGGNLTLGDGASFNGFRTNGQIKTGTSTVTLNSATFATLGNVTTIGGGSVDAANGVFLGGGKVITGSGAVNGKVAAETGSLIQATGDLSLGDSDARDGYFSNGTLVVGDNTVTLKDKNKAKLGSLTTLGNASGAGILAAANGLVLNGGHDIEGYGEVTADLENQGMVSGDGGVLELSGKVTGAGDYAGDILFTGEFMPGNSPALIEFENMTFEGLLNIEIGGLNPGTDYDVLAGTGDATLGGILDITFLNGFNPLEGDSFDILTAENIIGEFDLFTFSALGGSLDWDLQYIIDDLGTDIVRLTAVSSVPVPASVWLFASGLLGLVNVARRRKA